jgi:glyoxylase-like metal-dependent hydrolase (beta-lactamase superfamily II)
MAAWAKAFDCKVYLHAADKDWIMNPNPAVQLWDGDTHRLWDGVTLIRCGGHFPGGTVLHWQDGKQPRGVVGSGDILSVTADRKWVSFMRSYPNFIPLSAFEVGRIDAALAPFAFDKIYGHYFDRVIAANGKRVVERSVARYIAAINGVRGY